MLLRKVVLSLALLGFFQGSYAESPVPDRSEKVFVIYTGWTTGNGYERMNLPQRTTYVTAAIEGFFMAPANGGSQHVADQLNSCLSTVTGTQARAVVDKEHAAAPENWDQRMNQVVYNAILRMCIKKGFSFVQ
jgi:hypothetical protein